MSLFSLFYRLFFTNNQNSLYLHPYCSHQNRRDIKANLYYDRDIYDGQVCPGDYFLTIPGRKY